MFRKILYLPYLKRRNTFAQPLMLVMYFSACNMEEHEGIDPVAGGSRGAAPAKV
jgi:hypothetical protein